IVLSPGSYGIDLTAVGNRPYFAKVPAPARIDVKLAARLAEMPEDDFAALNPAFTKPVATSGTGYFLVPADKADTFQQNMELYRSLDGPMVSWQTASAKRGEGVDAVAKRYGLTASYLRATNGPLPEKKGKFTQPVSFMVPMHKEAKIISATIEKKVALKAAQPAPAPDATVAQIAAAVLTEPAVFTPPPVVVAQAAAAVIPDAVVAIAPPVSPAAPAIEPLAASAANLPISHRVKAGDTLFGIARQYGLTIDQIKAANSLSGNGVQVGQELAIAAAIDTVASTASSGLMKVAAVTRAAPAKITTYVVRNGDTLFGIALKFGVELADLLRWNKLSVKSVLQPGYRLRVTD
ncbi:MAG: LysM peptidoglycan-binding domain-containing protein, partial [Betaproteobacteria bacterium]|nr:LysM peptidoglycan-binding domain-containing protein [Betaproteobacteria bacterium]